FLVLSGFSGGSGGTLSSAPVGHQARLPLPRSVAELGSGVCCGLLRDTALVLTPVDLGAQPVAQAPSRTCSGRSLAREPAFEGQPRCGISRSAIPLHGGQTATLMALESRPRGSI